MHKLLIVLAAAAMLIGTTAYADNRTPPAKFSNSSSAGVKGVSPGNPTNVPAIEPRKVGRLGTSSPTGWGGPNPAAQRR
jgi:hypothetical protein